MAMAQRLCVPVCACVVLLLQLPCPVAAHAAPPPHIVFMLADDLGYADVSMHGGSQIPTPNLARLAADGAMLSQYYVQPVCSPTRATILSGRHVIHTGVYDPMNGGNGDLSLNFTLLPQHLNTLGYASHMVGKWHLGMSSWKYTPLQRGFSSYMGYLGGGEDYWLHGTATELDFWEEAKPVYNHTCWDGDACPHQDYSAHVFARQACRVIREAGKGAKPLFLYLAWQSVHSGGHLALQAPQDYQDLFNGSVSNDLRRKYAGMVHALDEGVGNVTKALVTAGMMHNTLIVFSTDNGGPADHFNGNMASNFPLRGMKRTLFEGGVRGVGLVSGAGIKGLKGGATISGFIHAADWMPTLLEAAGGDWLELMGHGGEGGEPPLVLGDGMSVWAYISGQATASPRTEILHEAHPHDSTDGNGNALRVGDWKVVLRTGGQWSTGSRIGSNDGWYGGVGSSDTATGSYAVSTGKQNEAWAVKCKPPPANITEGFACELRKGAGADDPKYACLFNIGSDPCEHTDLSAQRPQTLQRLLARLEIYRATAVDSTIATKNPDGRNCPGSAVQEGCGGAGALPPMNCTTQMPCGPFTA